jgi:hypothetical protein
MFGLKSRLCRSNGGRLNTFNHVGGGRYERNMVGSAEGTRIIAHDTCEWSEGYKHQTVKKKGEMRCTKYKN